MRNPFKRKSVLELAQERLQGLQNERQALETARNLQYEASRLEALKSQGEAFYEAPRETPAPPPPPTYHKVYVYEESATGYPFEPKVFFEQDPLFGWHVNPFHDYLDQNVALNSFPREMYPDRPSTLRTQIAQDAARFESRLYFERLPQYSGIISHLRNYVIGDGMTIDVVSKDDEELAKAVTVYLDEFANYGCNKLYKRLWDSVLNLYRDGEDAIWLLPGADYPIVRAIDVSTIRGPHNEVTGPWAFGVLTDWPRDWDDVRAYHLWFSDNTHMDVAPTVFKLAKLDTTGANVKRGVPLSYKIRKQLAQVEKLLDCMAAGEAARQGIPYIVQYQLADRTAVQGSINARVTPNWSTYQNNSGNPNMRTRIEPGAVQHINAGQEFQDPPQGHADSGNITYRALCESIATAVGVPIWVVTGSADSENYASALVSESPMVKNIQRMQKLVTEHYQSICEAAISIAIAKGEFPVNTLEVCNVHCELPSPVARDKAAEIKVYMELMNKECLSPQHLCTAFNLDFEEERELIKAAEASGWENMPEEEKLSERPTSNAPEGKAEKED